MSENKHATIINLDEDFESSAKRIEELKAGRDLTDIPLSDDYWKAVRKHQQAHNKKD